MTALTQALNYDIVGADPFRLTPAPAVAMRPGNAWAVRHAPRLVPLTWAAGVDVDLVDCQPYPNDAMTTDAKNILEFP